MQRHLSIKMRAQLTALRLLLCLGTTLTFTAHQNGECQFNFMTTFFCNFNMRACVLIN